jgi:hypothetical protein
MNPATTWIEIYWVVLMLVGMLFSTVQYHLVHGDRQGMIREKLNGLARMVANDMAVKQLTLNLFMAMNAMAGIVAANLPSRANPDLAAEALVSQLYLVAGGHVIVFLSGFLAWSRFRQVHYRRPRRKED